LLFCCHSLCLYVWANLLMCTFFWIEDTQDFPFCSGQFTFLSYVGLHKCHYHVYFVNNNNIHFGFGFPYNSWKELQLKFWLLSWVRKRWSTWGKSGAIFTENQSLMNLGSLGLPRRRLSRTPKISRTLNPDSFLLCYKTKLKSTIDWSCHMNIFLMWKNMINSQLCVVIIKPTKVIYI